MFRFKENIRLMPCMEQCGHHAYSGWTGVENTQSTKAKVEDGKELILKYLNFKKTNRKRRSKIINFKNSSRRLIK